jgi:uncharacterized membrane protein YdjX (TVP38/TMEM64 family)
MKRRPTEGSYSPTPRTLERVTASATSKITDTLRSLASGVGVAARQLSPVRVVVTVAVITVLAAVALLVKLPTAVQMRDWAESVGPWFPLAFLTAHTLATVVPVPRTAFTLAAGLLFGPLLGVSIAVVASAASAVIALLLVRAAGWRLDRLTHYRAIDRLNERLRERGWQAVLSLRLIPAVPFSVLNYAVGASAIRLTPYALATLAGVLPGTAAVVILGDALTGDVNPLLVLVSVCTGALGLAGLIYEVRHYRQHHPKPSRSIPERDETRQPAITH